jgi:hypothetical protein
MLTKLRWKDLSAEQPRQAFTRIAVAIIIASAIVAGAILVGPSHGAVVTETIPETTTEISSATLTTGFPTVTSTSTSTTQATTTSITTVTVTSSVAYHDLTFNQTSGCQIPVYQSWGVTLIGSDPSTQYPSDANKTAHTITFSVPDGTYKYAISSSDTEGNFYPSSGTVAMNGTARVVQVVWTPVSCGPLVGIQVILTSGTVSPGAMVNMTAIDYSDGARLPTGDFAWSDHGAGGTFNSLICALSDAVVSSDSPYCSVIYTIPNNTTTGCYNITITAIYLGDPMNPIAQESRILDVCP